MNVKTSLFGKSAKVCVKWPTSLPPIANKAESPVALSPALSLSLAPDLVTTFIMMNSNGGAGPGVTWPGAGSCQQLSSQDAVCHPTSHADTPVILLIDIMPRSG